MLKSDPSQISTNPHSQKVISFALFIINPGPNQHQNKYVIGIKENIKRAQIFFRGWVIHIHIDKSISKQLQNELKNYSNVQVFNHSKNNQNPPIFDLVGLRFLCHDPQNTKVLIIRDADCLLTQQDYLNTQYWISKRNQSVFGYYKSGRRNTFLAGAIGFKCEIFQQILNGLKQFQKTIDKNIYGWDEQFLDYILKDTDPYIVEIQSLQNWSSGIVSKCFQQNY